MTRRLWIADEVSGSRAAIVGFHADHLSRVLRVRLGQEFDISTPRGLRRGRVAEVTETRVEFELGEDIPAAAVPEVALLLSVFKFDRMEWAIEKCTELGAARIIPVVAQRTERHLARAAATRWERWQRLVREASEQSRRMTAPQLAQPLELRNAIASASGTRIVLSEIEHETMLKSSIAQATTVTLAFGPEGGWTDSELTLFGEAGWISASLGPTILRAETAAIAGLAIAIAELTG